uniref:Uncharacterized protein n=1 Tax=Physcomitrium patens TaxID=3218 RepID=A0A7I4EEC4_PHYPA
MFKEFKRNIRREYGRLLSVLQAYALIAKGVRIFCTNQVGKSGRTTIVRTQGSGSVKDNIISVFGSKTAACLEPLNMEVSDGCLVEGFISRPGSGCGRASGDRQFIYVNGRPVDLPKINKLLNELYGSFNSLQKPMAFLNFILTPTAYDVNVTPDKRKVFLHTESALLTALKEALECVYTPDKYTYTVNNFADKATSSQHGVSIVDFETQPLSPIGQLDPEEDDFENLEEKTATAEESEVVPMRRGGLGGGAVRTSLGTPTASPVSGRKDGSKNDFIDLANFKLKGARTVASEKGNVITPSDALVNNLKLNRIALKTSQSRLTGFVSTSKKTSSKKRDAPARMGEDFEMEEEDKMVTFEPSLDGTSAMEVEDITSTKKIQEKDPCCAGHTEHALTPAAPKLKLVIGLSEKEASSSKVGGDDVDLDKDDNHITGLEDEGVELSPLNRSIVDKAVAASAQVANQPSGPPVDTSEVLFDIHKLRRKSERGLLHFADTMAPQGKSIKRMRGFTAATLEAARVTDGGAGKEAALVAATKELERSFNKADFKNMKVVGQFNLGFVLAKLDQDLFIVDQHASDEKYNFERLTKSTILNKQPLLRPLSLELSAAEEVIVTTHIETFRQNGFDFVENEDAPLGSRLSLSAVPFSQNITFGIGDVQELVGILANGTAPVAKPSTTNGTGSQNGSQKGGLLSAIRPSRVRGMLASRACRSSIMIGDALCKKEMEKILCHLADLDAPWNCPHGRPTMRHLADLEVLRQK